MYGPTYLRRQNRLLKLFLWEGFPVDCIECRIQGQSTHTLRLLRHCRLQSTVTDCLQSSYVAVKTDDNHLMVDVCYFDRSSGSEGERIRSTKKYRDIGMALQHVLANSKPFVL